MNGVVTNTVFVCLLRLLSFLRFVYLLRLLLVLLLTTISLPLRSNSTLIVLLISCLILLFIVYSFDH